MKKFILTFIPLLISISFNTLAQKSIRDSLYTKLQHANNDTTKITLLNSLTLQLRRSFPDSALKLAQQAESLSLAINNQSLLAESYKNIGNIYFVKSKFYLTNTYYQKALDVYNQLNDTLGIAKIYNNLGALNRSQGNYIKTLEYYQKSLELRKILGDQEGMGKTFNNIGNVHYVQGNLDLALEYFNKSLNIRKKYNDKLGMSGCYNNIGQIYLDKKNYDTAIKYFEESIKIYKIFGDKRGISQCYKSTGNAYILLNNNSEALEYFTKALEIDTQLGEKTGMAFTFTKIASIYNSMKCYDIASHYAKKALIIANDIGTVIEKKNAYQQLSTAYEGLTNYEKALLYHKKFTSIKDSLFNIDKIKELETLEGKYQLENKQLQIKNLERDNELKKIKLERMKTRQLLSFIIIFISSVFILELLLSRKKLKRKNLTIFEQNEQITTQKNELEKHRNHLEQLVKERTKDLEEAKKKAEESDRLKSSFLANMSHEIRTPMNAIIGFSNLLTENNIDSDTKTNLINEITKNGFSLLQLIDNILDLAKIETGQIKINMAEFNLSNLLNDIYYSFYEIITNKNIDFIFNTNNREDLIMYSDVEKIKQILKNLIDNSIKFTEEGFIELGYFINNNGSITIYVKDTGIGITETQLKYLFARFSKIEDEKRKLYGGAGLGLSLCKYLSEAMGGKIWAESEPNKKTTFYLELPLNKVKKQDKQHKKPVLNTEKYNWKSKTVLIAEDDESNFQYFHTILSKTNINILRAKTGKQAVEQFKTYDIDLILMDIKMPEMDGLEAIRIIKEHKPNIPIIAQTAFTMENDEKLCKSVGCDAYIEKPIRKSNLFNLINQFLT